MSDLNSPIQDRSPNFDRDEEMLDVEAGTKSHPVHVYEQRVPISHFKPTDDLTIESTVADSNERHSPLPTAQNTVGDSNSPIQDRSSNCNRDEEMLNEETGGESCEMRKEEQRTAILSIELPEKNLASNDVNDLFNGSPYCPEKDDYMYLLEKEEGQTLAIDETSTEILEGRLDMIEPGKFSDDTKVTNEEKPKFGVPSFIGAEGPLSIMQSEKISNGIKVTEEGKTTIGVASLDSAIRGVCMVKILRDIADLRDVVPQTNMRHTAKGEFALEVSTNKELLYCLDTFPQKWTALKHSNKVPRLIFMCGALQILDDTDWSQF